MISRARPATPPASSSSIARAPSVSGGRPPDDTRSDHVLAASLEASAVASALDLAPSTSPAASF